MTAKFSNEQPLKRMIWNRCVPFLIRLLSSSDIDICQEAIWILRDIAAVGPSHQTAIINAGIIGALPKLLKRLHTHRRPYLMRNLVPILSQFCVASGSPLIVIALLERLHLLHHLPIIESFNKILQKLADGHIEDVQDVIDKEVVPSLVNLLEIRSRDETLLRHVLQMLQILVEGGYTIQKLIALGFLDKLNQILIYDGLHFYDCPDIKSKALSIITKVTKGTADQVQKLFDAGIVDSLLRFRNSRPGNDKAENEIVNVLTNIITLATPKQTKQFSYKLVDISFDL